jgi:hypothetical protein
MSAFSFLKNSGKRHNSIFALLKEAVLITSIVNNPLDGETNNLFFNSSFLKISVNQI